MSIDFQGLLNVLRAAENEPNIYMAAWAKEWSNEPVDNVCGTSHCMIGAFCASHPEDRLKLLFAPSSLKQLDVDMTDLIHTKQTMENYFAGLGSSRLCELDWFKNPKEYYYESLMPVLLDENNFLDKRAYNCESNDIFDLSIHTAIAVRFGITPKEAAWLFVNNPLWSNKRGERNKPPQSDASELDKERALNRLRKFIYYKLRKNELTYTMGRNRYVVNMGRNISGNQAAQTTAILCRA